MKLLSCLFFVVCSVPVFAQIPTPQWRPVYHFTPQKNWTNDPNGLLYLHGTYHLYNQQNPFENKWGHMSWGHATSNDLVHWNHLSIAIPETIDKDTTLRFSGSAVWDKNNTSGFCKTGGCIVAIYTADQPNLQKESQFIAYSNDGGLTYTNYENNPVIDLQKKDFRDPNVSWNEQLKQWLMVVSLPEDHTIQFYSSPNLKTWKLLSAFGPAGFTDAGWECPSFFSLNVKGNADKKKWVLVVSASGDVKGIFMQYFVGDFDGEKFTNDNASDVILPVDYGDGFYAAIPWNNTPANKKVFIGWLVPGPQETNPWTGQMSIPRDLGLIQTEQGIRLVQNPTSVIKNNLSKLSGKQPVEINNMTIVGEKEISIAKNHAREGNAYWLTARIICEKGVTAGFKIAQKKDKDNNTLAETVIGYDVAKQELFVDRSNAGNGKIKNDKLRQIIPLSSIGGKIKLEILLDKSSLEIFVNDGQKVLSTSVFPDKDANGLAVFSSGGKAEIQSLKVWDLSKIKGK